ncbi:hypothetical protein [Cysteiniphilum sp. QT6929]|uniref:hypothetical protein n=1 Tax=Cysteiniphilum sp. QT6929 TaxID=2975055 RepID=UPI0024B3B19F|nr:hypothetical protein [Cysteiniphilum sp. QT6929]WHN66485.1 hypothetical protein NYP54_04460 [Cysteiniphilum sp. QT6929]
MKMTKIIMSLCLVTILTGCSSKESPEAGSPAEYSLNLATESGTSVVGQLMSVNLQLNNSYNGLAIAGTSGTSNAEQYSVSNIEIIGLTPTQIVSSIKEDCNGLSTAKYCNFSFSVVDIDLANKLQTAKIAVKAQVNGQEIISNQVELQVKSLDLLTRVNESGYDLLHTVGSNLLIISNPTDVPVTLTKEVIEVTAPSFKIIENPFNPYPCVGITLNKNETCTLYGEFLMPPTALKTYAIGHEFDGTRNSTRLGPLLPGVVNIKDELTLAKPDLNIKNAANYDFYDDMGSDYLSFILRSDVTAFNTPSSKLKIASNADDQSTGFGVSSYYCDPLENDSECFIKYYSDDSIDQDVISISANGVILNQINLFKKSKFLLDDEVFIGKSTSAGSLYLQNDTTIDIPVKDIEFDLPLEIGHENGIIIENKCQDQELIKAGESCEIVINRDTTMDPSVLPGSFQLSLKVKVNLYEQSAQIKVSNVSETRSINDLYFEKEIDFIGENTGLVLVAMAETDLTNYKFSIPEIPGVNIINECSSIQQMYQGDRCRIRLDVDNISPQDLVDGMDYQFQVYDINDGNNPVNGHVYTHVPNITFKLDYNLLNSNKTKIIELTNNSLAPARNFNLASPLTDSSYIIDSSDCDNIIYDSVDGKKTFPAFGKCLIRVSANNIVEDKELSIFANYDHNQSIKAGVRLLSNNNLTMDLTPVNLSIKQMDANVDQVLKNESGSFADNITVEYLGSEENYPQVIYQDKDLNNCFYQGNTSLSPISSCTIKYQVPANVNIGDYEFKVTAKSRSDSLHQKTFEQHYTITVLNSSDLSDYKVIDSDKKFNITLPNFTYHGYAEFDAVDSYVYITLKVVDKVTKDSREWMPQDLEWRIIPVDTIEENVLDGVNYFTFDDAVLSSTGEPTIKLKAVAHEAGLYKLRLKAISRSDVNQSVMGDFYIVVHKGGSSFENMYDIIDKDLAVNVVSPDATVGDYVGVTLAVVAKNYSLNY